MALAGPTGEGNIGEDSVGWGDSAVWIPYQMYLMYDDRAFLEEHYDTTKKWVEFSLRCMKEHNSLYADKPWYGRAAGMGNSAAEKDRGRGPGSVHQLYERVSDIRCATDSREI